PLNAARTAQRAVPTFAFLLAKHIRGSHPARKITSQQCATKQSPKAENGFEFKIFAVGSSAP
ncbi:MAG: hypothetical protein ABI651_10615, partial [Verrucomicrobiota bacterium]